jgi:hypothetical protein
MVCHRVTAFRLLYSGIALRSKELEGIVPLGALHKSRKTPQVTERFTVHCAGSHLAGSVDHLHRILFVFSNASATAKHRQNKQP